jgi:hypothetical protein
MRKRSSVILIMVPFLILITMSIQDVVITSLPKVEMVIKQSV